MLILTYHVLVLLEGSSLGRIIKLLSTERNQEDGLFIDRVQRILIHRRGEKDHCFALEEN